MLRVWFSVVGDKCPHAIHRAGCDVSASAQICHELSVVQHLQTELGGSHVLVGQELLDLRKKLLMRAHEGMLLGYFPKSKGYNPKACGSFPCDISPARQGETEGTIDAQLD